MSVTLTYFDFDGGRGEHIRLAFSINKAKWVDNRIDYKADWPELKKKTPFGFLPSLKFGETTVTQSVPIMNYAVASGTGELDGKTPEDRLLALSLMEHLNELMGKAPQHENADEKKRLREEFAKSGGVLRTTLGELEKSLKAGGGTFFVGNKMSGVELMLYTTLHGIIGGHWDHVPASIVDDFPLLKKVYETTAKHEGVLAWNQERASKRQKKE